MKKLFYLIIVMLVLGLLIPAAAVADEPQSQSEGMVSTAAVLSLDGTWVKLIEVMTAPAFFSGGPWTWDSAFGVKFTITDWAVVTDIFKVYDLTVLVIPTPNLDDWDVLGLAGPMVSPPYTTDPATALADGRFSSAVIIFASGSHSITIEDIHIPPTLAGPPFIDGTVAFKAELYSLEVDIDIKPGSDPNSINLKSKGVIPVAFLGSAIFDVTTVDVTTLVFEGASPAHALTDPVVYAEHLQDVNLDGFMDLVCHFKTSEVGLVAGSTEATLTGETNDGVIVYGTDFVRIVGK